MSLGEIKNKLNFAWRLFMTAWCFILFGLGGLILAFLIFPILSISIRNKYERRVKARYCISLCFKLFLNGSKFFGVLDYEIKGKEILKSDKGCIVVANHPTLIDYVLIASAVEDIDCLVKGKLLKNPFMRGAISMADYLINSKAETILVESQKRLDAGDNILIFPEGTRTDFEQPFKCQRGAANMAIRTESNIRVVYIECSEVILGKQHPWYHVPKFKPLFKVEAKSLIKWQPFMENANGIESIAVRQLTKHLEYILPLGK